MYEFKTMICEVCGKECKRKSGMQKYCNKCSNMVHASQSKINMERFKKQKQNILSSNKSND